MISNLPDETLGYILSFLPTKEGVQTSVLSKRWRNLWKLVPSLDFSFDGGDLDLDAKRRFENYVDSVLVHPPREYIQRLYLQLPRHSDDSTSSPPYSNLNTWICTPLMKHVEELDLRIPFEFELPQILFSCETLRILKLNIPFFSNINVFNIPEVVCLPRLKVLHIRTLDTLKEGDMEKILLGCPAIEELSIDFIENAFSFITICIKSSSLKSLKLIVAEDCANFKPDKRLIIDAPNLELFELSSTSQFEVFEIVYFSKLIESTLNVWGVPFISEQRLRHRAYIVQLLKQISNARTLTLHGAMLLNIKLPESRLGPCFVNLTHLCVLGMKHFFWDGLFEILKNSPNLESIKLNKEDDSYKNVDESFLEKPVPKCLLSSLKTIEFRLSDTRDGDGSDEAGKMMIKYFLNHAMVLEKLKLTSRVLNSEEGCNLLEIISEFPRASSGCEFAYEKIQNQHLSWM